MAQVRPMFLKEENKLFDGPTNHGHGLGSGSGASMWLSGSSSSLSTTAASEAEKVKGDNDQMGGGRRYHISAEASQPIKSTTKDFLLAMNQSESGEVDLDLSFDFISQLESNRLQQTPQREGDDDDVAVIIAPINESPRGMSTAARWASRARKQPPSALLLHNNKKKTEHLEVTSQFSPISPLEGRNDNMQPLVVTPLSSTRRAFDSGIQQQDTKQSASAAATIKADLIRQQRLAAKEKQTVEKNNLRLSPEKGKRSAPFGFDYKDQTISSPHRKPVLGENKIKGNKQMLPPTEQGDVFVDDANYDYKKHLKKSPSLVSTKTGGAISSFATAAESQGAKTRRSRRQKGSVESTNTFDTAMTREISDIPSIDVQPPPMPSGNALGLSFLTSMPPPEAAGLRVQSEQAASPQSTQHSSPDTPFSPLFSDSGTAKDSEYTHGTQSEGIRTPGTAFSTLFEERGHYAKSTESAPSRRASANPVSNASIVKDIIQEEDGGAAALQVRTAPPTSFVIDLPETSKGESESRHRQDTSTTTSDFGSSPMKGDQTMVLSTTSSPVEEVEFLFRKPSQAKTFDEKRQASGARAGPWPQSPLLLTNFLQGDISDELKGALGLGIDMGRPEEADLQQHDTSDLSVERVLLSNDEPMTALGLDLGTQHMHQPTLSQKAIVENQSLAPPTKEALLRKSPSTVSSVEGFAINVTPTVKEKPDLQIDVPKSLLDDIDEAEKLDRQGKGRWSSKLWNMASKSPLSPFHQSRSEDKQSPPMRSLTLVSKREEGEERPSGRFHLRSHSKRDTRDSLRVEEDDGYHSMPSSAALPTTATFSPLQAPAQALYSRPRSSRHVKRSSRLPYVADSDHIHVDMSSPLADESVAGARDFSRAVQDPSSLTPKMEYLINAKSNRHSWGYSSPSENGAAVFSNWLAPKRQSVTFQRDSEMFANLRNSTLSAIGPEKTDPSSSQQQKAMEAIVEDGIRRRANHRATNSVPSTPTMIPELWSTLRHNNDDHHQDQEGERDGVDNSDHVQFQIVQPIDDSVQQQSYQPRNTFMKTLSFFGPASAAFTPYLFGLTGSNDQSKAVQQKIVKHSSDYKEHFRLSLFTDNRGGPEGLIAYSGRALENTRPSRALFLAGFLGMPWLWFIGGWGLEKDGSVYLERDNFWEEGGQEAILFDLLQNQPTRAMTLHASSRSVHHAKPSIHRGSIQSMTSQDNGLNNERLRYSMGKPDSIINMEAQANPEDEDETDRHQSIDLEESSNNQQTGIAYSTEGDHAEDSPVNVQGKAFSLPISQWDEYDDKNAKKQKEKSFFKQILEANTTMLNRMTSQSSSSIRQAQRNRNSIQQHTSNRSAIVAAVTDWKRLDSYVLWNRILALSTSLAVFGAFAVAIYFVVNDW